MSSADSFLGVCNSAGVSFVYSKRDLSTEVWDFTDLTFQSPGLLQPSQLPVQLRRPCLSHQRCTCGFSPALLAHGLLWVCVVASDSCKLSVTSENWESLFLGEWPPSAVSLDPCGWGWHAPFSVHLFVGDVDIYFCRQDCDDGEYVSVSFFTCSLPVDSLVSH